jgi:hypothetical protein
LVPPVSWMNRFRLPGDGLLSLGDLGVDAVQGAAGTFSPVLVVGRPFPLVSPRTHHGRLGEHQLVRRSGVWMLTVPLGDGVGDVGQFPAHDEIPAGVLDVFEVRLAHHPRISHHGDPGDTVRLDKGTDQRDHRAGFGTVALERVHHQRCTGRIGQQAHGDLRLETPLFGEPRLTEPVTGVGLEPKCADVVQHQRRRA